MSFEYLGKKPPKKYEVGALGFKVKYESKNREEHFRGALKEAAEYTQTLKRELPNVPLKKRKVEYFWWCDRMDELWEMLRVSAGEPEK